MKSIKQLVHLACKQKTRDGCSKCRAHTYYVTWRSGIIENGRWISKIIRTLGSVTSTSIQNKTLASNWHHQIIDFVIGFIFTVWPIEKVPLMVANRSQLFVVFQQFIVHPKPWKLHDSSTMRGEKHSELSATRRGWEAGIWRVFVRCGLPMGCTIQPIDRPDLTRKLQ